MGAISPETPGPTLDAERHEWQGQKWEYLIVRLNDPVFFKRVQVGGRTEWKFLQGDKEKDPVAEYYNSRFLKDHGAERDLSITEALNELGKDGWEIITGVSGQSSDGTGLPLIFFKRPLASPQ